MAKGIKRPLPLVVEALKVVIKKLEECLALLFNYQRMDYNTLLLLFTIGIKDLPYLVLS